VEEGQVESESVANKKGKKKEGKREEKGRKKGKDEQKKKPRIVWKKDKSKASL